MPVSREPEPERLLSREAGAAAGLPPDAIASHAEPAKVKADAREEVGVGQGGQPKGPVSRPAGAAEV